ncbi:protocadherin gamma-A4-like [Mytilus californianus]|uniref:protocadherin gamma-A4-like n=1 Tax=Mytilus californianus TaxID=6549 RepID=UPI0022463A2B|nr:protocadherin gamma-A4-like [Mytilus californianus]
MFQYKLFLLLFIFPFPSQGVSTQKTTHLKTKTTAEQPDIRCNIRKPECPNGFCCARDEFLPEYTMCKHTGKIESSCSTVINEAKCPCETGLVCVPNVNSADFVSIYGKCQNNITTTHSTVATVATTVKRSTTILTTTTKKQHKEHNHPPIIQFQSLTVKVSKFSNVGQPFSRFTVKDDDQGKNGIVQCSVIQPGFFRIEKVDSHLFQVVVATSLESLTPQRLSTLIMCQDNGTPPLNGLIQVAVNIVFENLAIDTTKLLPSTSVTMKTLNSKLGSISSKTETSQTVNNTPSTENSKTSSSQTSETSTERPIHSDTFN